MNKILSNPESADIDVKDLTYIAIFNKSQKVKLNFNLEKDAKLTFIALILGDKKLELKLETRSTHKENSTANFHIKTLLFDKANFDYSGSIEVPAKAKNTNANLAHHTLLLSENAKARTTPALIINEEDVKAGHQATIGKIDPNILFYIQSRGLNKKEAERLILKAFLSQELHLIDDPEVKTAISKEIQKFLTKNTQCSTPKK